MNSPDKPTTNIVFTIKTSTPCIAIKKKKKKKIYIYIYIYIYDLTRVPHQFYTALLLFSH